MITIDLNQQPPSTDVILKELARVKRMKTISFILCASSFVVLISLGINLVIQNPYHPLLAILTVAILGLILGNEVIHVGVLLFVIGLGCCAVAGVKDLSMVAILSSIMGALGCGLGMLVRNKICFTKMQRDLQPIEHVHQYQDMLDASKCNSTVGGYLSRLHNTDREHLLAVEYSAITSFLNKLKYDENKLSTQNEFEVLRIKLTGGSCEEK